MSVTIFIFTSHIDFRETLDLMHSGCCTEQTGSHCFPNGYPTTLNENKIVNRYINCWMVDPKSERISTFTKLSILNWTSIFVNVNTDRQREPTGNVYVDKVSEFCVIFQTIFRSNATKLMYYYFRFWRGRFILIKNKCFRRQPTKFSREGETKSN